MNQIKIIPVEKVSINLYGNIIVPELKENLKFINNNSIPFEINFNSNWEIIIQCKNCSKEVSFGQNFEKNFVSYTVINNLNSQSFRLPFLEFFTNIFKNLHICKVGEFFYINRLDFKYEFDMQRMSSITPILINCNHCKSQYLARIRIGLPQPPDRDMIYGKPGKICIDEIIYINFTDGKYFEDLIEEYKN